MIIVFELKPHSYQVGDQRAQVITSYLYKSETVAIDRVPVVKKAEIFTKKNTHQASHEMAMKTVTSHSANKHMQPSVLNSESSQGQAVPELLTLLHAAIQKQQHYPLSALQLEREGRVTLKFLLFSNGHIEDLKVLQSSGTTSLDEAAIAAVKQAAPFAQVDKYLHDPQEYSIDVVFELT